MFVLQSAEIHSNYKFKQMTGWNFEHGYSKKSIMVQQNEDLTKSQET